MVRTLIIILAFASGLLGQSIITIPDEQVRFSLDKINTNFAYLDAKMARGTTAPSGACTPGYIYVRTAQAVPGSSLYVCVNTGTWEGPYPLNSTGGTWGTIVGTLAAQTDLQAALNARLLAANNLSDIASQAAARGNLGLGTAATQASSAFEPAVGAGTTAQYRRGDKTWQTLSSDVVPEGISNLYFTAARVHATLGGTTNLGVPIATGTGYTVVPLLDCHGVSGKMGFSATSRAFTCDPDQTGGGGGTIVNVCEISVEGDPVADTQDAPYRCKNLYGVTQTITAVQCMSDAAATVRPLVSGGAADSILSGVITCGTGGVATSGTLQGTPTLAPNQTVTGNVVSANGATYITILLVTTRTL